MYLVMKISHIILLLCCSAKALNSDELEILTEVIGKWQITRVIFVKEENEQILPDFFSVLKTLACASIFSTVWPIQHVLNYTKQAPVIFDLPTFPNGVLIILQSSRLKLLYRPYLDIETVARKNAVIELYSRSWFKWLTFWSNVSESPALSLSIPLNTHVLVVLNTSPGFYAIESLYNVANTSFVSQWGRWSRHGGFNAVPLMPRLLNGSSIRRQYLTPELYGAYLPLLAPNQEILDSISNMLNFSFVQLMEGERDYFIFDVSDTLTILDKVAVSSSIGPTIKIKLNLFIKGLGEEMLSSYFIRPFHKELWLVLCGWIIMAMLTVAMIHLLAGERRVLMDNVAAVFEAFCNQSGSWVDTTPHGRIHRVATWTTVAIVLPSYTAVIIAFMTARQEYAPFSDLYGLASDGRYKLGLQKGSAPLALTHPTLSAAANKVLVSEQELPHEVSIASRLVCNGRYAFIGYNDLIRGIPGTCDILKLKDPVLEIFSALPLQPYSPFTKHFSSELVKFHMNGMMSRFQKNLDEPVTHHSVPNTLSVELLLIQDLYIILFVGMVAALFSFIIEVFHSSLVPSCVLAWLK